MGFFPKNDTSTCIHCGRPIEHRAFREKDYYGLRWEHVDGGRYCDAEDDELLEGDWATPRPEDA